MIFLIPNRLARMSFLGYYWGFTFNYFSCMQGMAVSYTHLDVYKRQILVSANNFVDNPASAHLVVSLFNCKL